MTKNPANSTKAGGTVGGGGTGGAATQVRPTSPSNSFYALSDDEEGEYDTVTHTSSGRGVKLLFSKSKVCFAWWGIFRLEMPTSW
jgi:hypothetical protein